MLSPPVRMLLPVCYKNISKVMVVTVLMLRAAKLLPIRKRPSPVTLKWLEAQRASVLSAEGLLFTRKGVISASIVASQSAGKLLK